MTASASSLAADGGQPQESPGATPGQTPEMDLLRFAAVGSVDDGKSTLIGRLLFDTRQLFDDQLAAITAASEAQGHRGRGPLLHHRRPAG